MSDSVDDKKAFAKKAVFTKTIFVSICVFLIAIIVAAVQAGSLRFNATVITFSDKEPRVGSKSTGYINIPKGFREYEGVWYYEVMDVLQTDADLKFFASEEVQNESNICSVLFLYAMIQ